MAEAENHSIDIESGAPFMKCGGFAQITDETNSGVAGHSDIGTTANIYSHLDYKSKITSAQAMETGLALPEGGDFSSRWSSISAGENS